MKNTIDLIILQITGEHNSYYKHDFKEDRKVEHPIRIHMGVIEEFKKLKYKCESIKKIDGQKVEIISLNMTGQDQIQNIELTYIHQNQTHKKNYAPQEIYDL